MASKFSEKCTECGAYDGHSPDCSLMSEEYAKSELKRYHHAWLEQDMKNKRLCETYNTMAQRKINRLKDDRDKWKGKYMTVKEENNKLRKQKSQ
jgi:hypothetical protein